MGGSHHRKGTPACIAAEAAGLPQPRLVVLVAAEQFILELLLLFQLLLQLFLRFEDAGQASLDRVHVFLVSAAKGFFVAGGFG